MVNCIYFYNCMLELGDVEKMLKVDCIFCCLYNCCIILIYIFGFKNNIKLCV